MKKAKKIVAVALAAASMSLAFAGCGGSAESSKADNSGTDGKVYNIGICQLVQHEALDAATKGFKDYLTEKLGADNVKFDEQNAQGDSATCATICNQFVSSNYYSRQRYCRTSGSIHSNTEYSDSRYFNHRLRHSARQV